MTKKPTTKKAKEEEVVVPEKATKTDSEFAKLLEIYKIQHPAKYELKKEELLKKLESNK